MKKLPSVLPVIVVFLFVVGLRAAEVSVELGSEAQAKRLFSYPNKGHENDDLAKTIKHYMVDAINREAIPGVSVSVSVSPTSCLVKLVGPHEPTLKSLKATYEEFFKTGEVGLVLADSFSQSDKWKSNWKFLLPLGVPVLRAHAVEVMNFPPVSLIEKQDYYDSKTTNRWWALLLANGVSDAEKYLYSCILDIVPVAAPAGDGKLLDMSGIYDGPFDRYSLRMLRLMGGGDSPRPLMALGAPIRKWISRLSGKNLGMLEVATVSIAGRSYPVIASNHPSFFFYAVRKKVTEEQKLAVGLAIMRQDIVAAAWHREMGRDPSLDPTVTLQKCQAKWKDRDAELLRLVRKHANLPRRFPFFQRENTAEIFTSASSQNLAELEASFDEEFEQR